MTTLVYWVLKMKRACRLRSQCWEWFSTTKTNFKHFIQIMLEKRDLMWRLEVQTCERMVTNNNFFTSARLSAADMQQSFDDLFQPTSLLKLVWVSCNASLFQPFFVNFVMPTVYNLQINGCWVLVACYFLMHLWLLCHLGVMPQFQPTKIMSFERQN